MRKQLDGARLVLSAAEVTILLGDPDAEAPAVESPPFELGADHLWEGSGTFEEAARTFLAEVLDWRMATLLDQGLADMAIEIPTSVFLVFENADGRPIELDLALVSGSTDRWRITRVSAGIEHTAYIRTSGRGTVAIPIDEQAVAAAEVPLDGAIEVGHPFCQIESTLLPFENREGNVTSAVGGVIHGTETPPACPAP